MLIKRLEGAQAAKTGTTGPTTQESQKAPAAQPNPYASPKSANNTEVMPGTGTAPLPRNTVLQGRYDVEEVLGVGGMSTVYKARDLRFTAVTRYCAVKEMPDNSPDVRTGQIRLANFEREASLLATLSHPGIPKIYDFFTAHGRVYLVLEFIDGKDLESQLNAREHPMMEEEVVRLAVQVCDVLEYLHGHKPQPIVFRDLKPSNMILQADGKLTLIDFGIAKVFQSDKRGTMIGTEGYAPPEQYRGLADPRGDIYGLGATMHHLLTKSDPRIQTPFTFHERPIRKFNPRVSEYTESVILQAVEYDIERRWPSAPAFRQALMQTSVLDPKLKKRQSGPLSEDQAPLIEQAPIPGLSGMPTGGSAAPPLDLSSGILLAPSYSTPKDRPASSAPERAPVPASVQAGAEGAQVLWTFTADDEIRSSPLCSRGVVFFGAYDTNLYALNAKSGDFLWKAPTKAGICSSPTMVGDIVIVGSEDNYVYGIDARRGATTWAYRTGGPVRSSPKVYKDMLFIGSDDQHIYALQAETGQVMWKYRSRNHIRSSAATAKGLAII
ncbi:MAG: serine/threonine-protein kinase, partial [Chloroflexota bacterium]|nr:serine/threonine-protein kinase [Chloroflexota bacterium]